MKHKILLWKSMGSGLRSWHGDIRWKVGKWFKHNGPLNMCKSGFHASKRIVEAMGYVNCEVIALVGVRGEHLSESDGEPNKECWAEMRIIRTYKWNRADSVSLAVFAAEKVLSIYEKRFPDNKGPRKAIETAKQYQTNPETTLAPAWVAEAAKAVRAAAAAWASAGAAWAAAAAAWAAAKAATGIAEEAAIWAARSAAWAALAADRSADRPVIGTARRHKTMHQCEKFIMKRIGFEFGKVRKRPCK